MLQLSPTKLEAEGDNPKGKGKKRKNFEEADLGEQIKQKKVAVAKFKIQAELNTRRP